MNSRIFLIVSTLALVTACQTSSDISTEGQTKDLVDAKYSLAKDRSEFEQLRESIPTETRRTNDEKALKAEWMGEVKLAPEVVRDKMSRLVQKKRDLFNKDMTRKREDFNKNERKSREEFTKQLEEERKEFLSRKVDRDKRARFFDDQDEKRREYSAEQKDKRETFESDVREQRKNFEDYLKEKNDEFQAELKDYRIRWTEKHNSNSP